VSIVPRNRLLFWMAAIVLPFGLLGGVEPAVAGISLVLVCAFILLVIVDAVAARNSLNGLELVLPEICRMSNGRKAGLEMQIHNQLPRQRQFRMALDLPPEISTDAEEQNVVIPAETEWSKLVWHCTPMKRGNYRIAATYVEGISQLGFWAARKRFAVKSELRVYPNLLNERKGMAALFLNRGSTGLHAQRQIGKGRDFEKLREYIPGDGFDEVHWKATAKRGKPITKIFQIERTQEVYVIVDASRLSARMTSAAGKTAGPDRSHTLLAQDSTALERFVTAALMLGLAAEQQGDLFGLLTFSNKVETFVRAKNGKAHYSACRDALYTLEPRIVTPDFDELCTFIRTRLRRRALLVFLTSLDDPVLAESFVKNLELVRRQHLVLVNMLQPVGAKPLFATSDVESLDDLYRHFGGHLQWQKLKQLGKVLQRQGVQFSLLENERLSADLVSQYLSVKQRQLL
jgi:uncharacterized protein (DUF58 family)